MESAGGSSSVFKKALPACGLSRSAATTTPTLNSADGRFQMDRVHQVAHLVNGDDARFGFRAHPEDVGMVVVFDPPAGIALAAGMKGPFGRRRGRTRS